jgi:UDPglucose 6-dehydrogenase
MNKSVAVCGSGFVGGSLSTVLAEKGLRVYNYDKMGKRPQGNIEPELFTSIEHMVTHCETMPNFSNVYFVCVPTPMLADGDADLTIVDNVLNELASVPGERIAVVKSTVPPGSTESWNKKYGQYGLHVIHSPEFLREATALDDMRNQDRIILGGPRPWINTVRDVFRTAFPDVPVFKTSSSNSEMIKYVINTFLTTKVLFANEIYQICEKLTDCGEDVDYDRIVELASLDKRLGTSHWKVPGPMPADDGTGKLLRGVAGSCFVKDINALIATAKKIGVDPRVLEAVWKKNLDVRPERDWENLVGRAVTKKQ